MARPVGREAAHTNPGGRPHLAVVVLGVTQILAWGSSYYLPAVVGPAVAAEMGWPLSWAVGGLSLGLLASGLISPRVGRAIHRRGGRPVLAFGSAALAAGLCSLGVAQGMTTYLAAWGIIGIGMGAGLYDAAFSTLGRLYAGGARRLIGIVTLFGGLASTVCWPLSAFLLDKVGWRGTCLTYAGIELLFALPLQLLAIPRAGAPPEPALQDGAGSPAGLVARADVPLVLLLAIAFALVEAVTSVISVNLLTILQAEGVAFGSAIALGALIGPAQVGARAVEIAFGRLYHPVWTWLTAATLVAAGLGLLSAAFPVLAVPLALYGAGIGISSIARGTLPLALFGSANYAALMGMLAAPNLIIQALSPWLGALLLQRTGPETTMSALVGVAVANVLLAMLLWIRCRPRNREAAIHGSLHAGGPGE